MSYGIITPLSVDGLISPRVVKVDRSDSEPTDQPLSDVCFQWTIDNFLSKAWFSTVYSPVFKFADKHCFLSIELGRKTNHVKLYFRLAPPSVSGSFHVKLGMRTGKRGKQETRSGEINKDGYFIVDVWMPCSEMLERRLEILSDGCLTVFCDLRRLDGEENAPVLHSQTPSEKKRAVEKEASDSDSDEEEIIRQWKIVKKMKKDFNSLLMNREDSDVTMRVQGKEFPAHRSILRARSPVFKSMFSHDMVEKKSGVVTIEDCDPVTFPDFLHYIYTGSVKQISINNVSSLYFASDKYGVNELKKECVLFMKNSLSVENFCDVLTLAFRHDEEELTELATDFFCDHKTEIMKTPEWVTFLHENTKEGNALLIKTLLTR